MDACVDYLSHFGKATPHKTYSKHLVFIFSETLMEEQAVLVEEYSSSSDEFELDDR